MLASGRIVDLHERRVFSGEIRIENGRIAAVRETETVDDGYLLPGFVDAHVHVESSMLVPSAFARLAVRHGTVATVSDPHEIGNVLGVAGVRFMIEDGARVPFKFYFGAPSCVPATTFESAGAVIGVEEVEELLRDPAVKYLSEMMNYPGVLFGDETVLRKIAAAKRLGKPVDGHAPMVRGEDARRYAAAGISTDHECTTIEEAREKLACGMKILIREGSAARNFDALVDLFAERPDRLMFCSDDKHPDELIEGHINDLARRAVARGYDVFDVLRAACVHPVEHYDLDVGLLREGDPADLIRVDSLDDFRVRQTYVDGRLVAEQGRERFGPLPVEPVNRFRAGAKAPAEFRVEGAPGPIRVIRAIDGAIVTEEAVMEAAVEDGRLVADPGRDLLKIAVVNRYADADPAAAFVTGFGLREGAIASSVAHDSHNIIAVGVDDEALSRAVNLIVENQGGICAVSATGEHVLPLPVAGLMAADGDGEAVGWAYAAIDRAAKEMGSTLRAPFMTLSFMALLVIPALKLSDLGLFDGRAFGFVPLSVEEPAS